MINNLCGPLLATPAGGDFLAEMGKAVIDDVCFLAGKRG